MNDSKHETAFNVEHRETIAKVEIAAVALMKYRGARIGKPAEAANRTLKCMAAMLVVLYREVGR